MTAWVLLRGVGREARHWGAFVPSFERHLPMGDTVHALDLPGNGQLWRETSPCSVALLVASARAQLVADGHQPPYALVALSLGGMVALEWAARAPGELEACVLINSSVAGLSPLRQRLQPGRWAGLLRAALPGSAAARERAVHAMTSARPVDDTVVARWVGIARSRPVSVMNVVRQLIAAATFRASGRLDVPALVLASRGDRLVSPECSRAIARTWKLPLREHPEAGHDLPLDAPDWVAEQVARWWPEHLLRR